MTASGHAYLIDIAGRVLQSLLHGPWVVAPGAALDAQLFVTSPAARLHASFYTSAMLHMMIHRRQHSCPCGLSGHLAGCGGGRRRRSLRDRRGRSGVVVVRQTDAVVVLAVVVRQVHCPALQRRAFNLNTELCCTCRTFQSQSRCFEALARFR